VTRVLVVEDDAALRRSLTLNLKARSYEVDETGNGEDAFLLAGRTAPDIVLLDLGLPGISGLEVITGIRSWSDIPIVVLSARGAERDKVEALDAGADDFVTKPFGIEELLARLRVAERQLAARRRATGPVVTSDLVVDLERHTVTAPDGEAIHLTPIEFALLAHLVAADGGVVEHTDLLRAVWGPGYDRDTNYLRVHVTNLRKKIELDPSHPAHVITEPGVGYRFLR
jgi:two-component system KDP operon response regulator KdpE